MDNSWSEPIEVKDSGIEWLGDIPKHWEVLKLTGLCDLVRGNSTFKKDELLSSGKYVALQYGKTYKVSQVDENYQFFVNDEFFKDSQIVNYGDIIIISTSETIQDLGHSVFYSKVDIGLLGGEQLLLKPKNNLIDGKFLYYATKIFSRELKKHATGVKVYRFNINDLKTIYTCIPPLQEQLEIANYIENESQRINMTISTIEKEITLVQEYKTALIAEAVTGKIDVRDFVVPDELVAESYEDLEEELGMVAEDEVEYGQEEMEE
jgi:type I restriction enzyme, S subunit